MARQRLTYRERDLAAALKLIRREGIKISRIEIGKDGVSIILVGEDAKRSTTVFGEGKAYANDVHSVRHTRDAGRSANTDV